MGHNLINKMVSTLVTLGLVFVMTVCFTALGNMDMHKAQAAINGDCGSYEDYDFAYYGKPNATKISYLGKLWDVIGVNADNAHGGINGDGDAEGIAGPDGTATLLLDNSSMTLVSATPFDSTSNAYDGSGLQQAMLNYFTNTLTGDKTDVQPRTLYGGSAYSDSLDGYNGDTIAGTTVYNQPIWPLSVHEASQLRLSVRMPTPYGGQYWLRSPGAQNSIGNDYAAFVEYEGDIYPTGVSITSTSMYSRPAMYISLNNKAFSKSAYRNLNMGTCPKKPTADIGGYTWDIIGYNQGGTFKGVANEGVSSATLLLSNSSMKKYESFWSIDTDIVNAFLLASAAIVNNEWEGGALWGLSQAEASELNLQERIFGIGWGLSYGQVCTNGAIVLSGSGSYCNAAIRPALYATMNQQIADAIAESNFENERTYGVGVTSFDQWEPPALGSEACATNASLKYYDLACLELEDTPSLSVNYTSEQLDNLEADTAYKYCVDTSNICTPDGTNTLTTGGTQTTLDLATGLGSAIAVPAHGENVKYLRIVKVSTDADHADSAVQSLRISPRPAAPTAPSVVNASGSDITVDDGKIEGVTEDMEYCAIVATSGVSTCPTYTAVTSTQASSGITGLAEGSYKVRVKAVDGASGSFSSADKVLTVGRDVVHAQTPVFAALSPYDSTDGLNYEVNTAPANLVASATVTDGGTITYNWYECSSETAETSTCGTPIGTNASIARPNLSTETTKFWRVFATNTNTLVSGIQSASACQSATFIVKTPVAPKIECPYDSTLFVGDADCQKPVPVNSPDPTNPGTCSDLQYLNQESCEFADGTWTESEFVPAPEIDYIYETLHNLESFEDYKVCVGETAVCNPANAILWAEIAANELGSINLIGDLEPTATPKKINIIRTGTDERPDDSAAVQIVIPARPATPSATTVNASGDDISLDDGKIVNVTSAMEYCLSTSCTSYTPITGTEVLNLAPAEYKVRVKAATGSNFKSDYQTVTIGRDMLNVVDPANPGTCTDVQWLNQEVCEFEGGDWISAPPIVEPGQCTIGSFVNQADCTSAGGTWIDEDGNVSYCSNPTYTNKADCEDSGANWVVGQCSLDGYYTFADCTAATDPSDGTTTGKWTYFVSTHFGVYFGSGERTARVEAPLSEFVRLIHNSDNRVLEPDEYIASPGSTVLTLTEAHANTYPVGLHYFTAQFTNGTSTQIVLEVRPPAVERPLDVDNNIIVLPDPEVRANNNTSGAATPGLGITGTNVEDYLLLLLLMLAAVGAVRLAKGRRVVGAHARILKPRHRKR
ncbi:hypothetical protein FACS1894125_4560 [Actinomycetota bacterium]|nr:hypothetical protein FACS1894125_4560 [Actinomycetota bacterium]